MWAGWHFGDRLTCEDCRWAAKGQKDCTDCPRTMELSPLAEMALETWAVLRRHGADIDGFSGVVLPIRLEAMRMECDRHPAAEEIFWRVSLIDSVYVDEQAKKRKKEEDRKKHSGRK